MKLKRIMPWIPVIGYFYVLCAYKKCENVYEEFWGNLFNFLGTAIVHGISFGIIITKLMGKL